MKKLKIGIIGLGVGEKHLEAYKSHPSCEVISLCDFSREKAMSLKRKYSSMDISIAENADEILLDKDIDIVSVASYDNFHYDQVLKAADNEKHVFVEKPFCLHKKEAGKIRELFNAKPHLKLSTNLILRKSPRFQAVKKIMDKGEFGEAYYIEGDYNYGRIHKLTDGWRGDMDFYSVIYGGGVHIIDLMLWITGERIVEVFTYGNKIATKGSRFRHNDLCVSLLKFESGMIGKITCNFACVFPHFHNFTIYGTDATFVNDFEHGRLIKSRERNAKERKIEESQKSVHKGGLIKSFVDSILDKTAPEVGINDVFNSMSVCFAMEESLRTSNKVRVEYL